MSQQIVIAAKAAKAKDCTASANTLVALLQSRSVMLGSGRRLSDDILSVTADFQPQSLGVEYTPERWAERTNESDRQLLMLNYLSTQCPDNETLTKTVAKIFPGPEYEYENSHRNMTKAEPLEDPAVRAKIDQTLAKFQTAATSPIPQLNREAMKIALDLIERTKKGEAVSNSEISNLMKVQGPGPLAEQAKIYIETYHEILAFNPERNAKMADRVLANGGNYLIVIGNAHAGDLANRLYERCLKGEGQPTITAGMTSGKGSESRATRH